MKGALLMGVLALATMHVTSAEELILSDVGEYRMSEFDTLHSGIAMAEQQALGNMASKVKQRVLSIKNIDTNGYYTRASWLINSAVINKKQSSTDVGVCADGNGLCATVTVEAVFDTEYAKKQLDKLYSDVEITRKLDDIIQQDKLREQLIMEGSSVDFAEAKQRLEKRKMILDYLSTKDNKKSLMVIDNAVFNDMQASSSKHQKQDLTSTSLLLEYQYLLNSIKSDLTLDVLNQRGVVHDDGTGGVVFTVGYESPQLVKALNWVAEQLGVPEGEWDQYADYRQDSSHNKSWLFPVRTHKETRYKEEATESVIVGLEESSSGELAHYSIQYGLDGIYTGAFADKSDYRLDYKKTRLVTELSSKQVCIDFTLGHSSPVEKCVTGSGESSDSSKAGAWNKREPYLWFAKNKSKFNLFIPLNRKVMSDSGAMKNLKFQYRVTVKETDSKV